MSTRIIIIKPKDIQRITDVGYKTATRLHRKIRLHFGKSDYQFISIEEFCAFTGLSVEAVRKALSG